MKVGRSSGFSLVESIIAMAISSVIGVALMTGTIVIHRTLQSVSEESDQLRAMRRVDHYLAEDARCAVSFTVVSDEAFFFTDRSGTKTTYQLTPVGDLFRLERVSSGVTIRLIEPVVSWTSTAPTANAPLELRLMVRKLDTRGEWVNRIYTRNYTFRGF